MRRFASACRFACSAFLATILVSTVVGQSGSSTFAPPPAPQKQAPEVEKHLKTFDVLDFDVFSNQKWDRLGESHAKDIVVTWPDGHETHGIERHIEDLKALFVYAPDLKISVHPIRFGSGDWTTKLPACGTLTHGQHRRHSYVAAYPHR
jgi:hypothetical protein